MGLLSPILILMVSLLPPLFVVGIGLLPPLLLLSFLSPKYPNRPANRKKRQNGLRTSRPRDFMFNLASKSMRDPLCSTDLRIGWDMVGWLTWQGEKESK